MKCYDYDDLMDQAEELARKIIKRLKGFGVAIDIKDKGIEILENGSFKFKVKLLQGTRVSGIKKHERDVQMALKLQLFQVVEDGLRIFIVASKEMNIDNRLLQIIASPEYKKAKKEMQVAHPIGFDASGTPLIADLKFYPHAMICGTTGSGKSEAIKSLIATLVFEYSTRNLSLLICDRASDLLQFADTPHLAYPIIEDFDTFLNVMLLLEQEMERRIPLKNTYEFSKLPFIVCIIDEFPAFITGTKSKENLELVRKVISDILRRARHVKIHMILATHNTTKKRMSIDIDDIPTKMALKVRHFTDSVMLIGTGGAEKLRGMGDMLFQSSLGEGLKRIQGAYISPEEIDKVIEAAKLKHISRSPESRIRDRFISAKYDFAITESDLQRVKTDAMDVPIGIITKPKRDIDGELFAKIIIWALGRRTISCNLAMETFGIGWNRAKDFLDRLFDLEIAGDFFAKLPRAVLPTRYEDLSDDALNILELNGYTIEHIREALDFRSENP